MFKMKPILLLFFFALLMATPCIAAMKTVTLSFDYSDGVDSFRAYERTENGKQLRGECPGEQREIAFDMEMQESGAYTFFVAAVLDGVEAFEPTNGITKRPVYEMPAYVEAPVPVVGTEMIIKFVAPEE